MSIEGNLTGNQFMQEAANDEIEIRILEAYDEDAMKKKMMKNVTALILPE